MKKTYLIIVISFCFTAFYGQEQEYKKLVKKADSLLQAKDFINSANSYSAAFKTIGGKGTRNDRYDAARAWSMANIPDSAFYNLQRIVDKLYYSDYEKVSKESEFSNLHKDSRWPVLLDQMKANKLPTGWSRAGDQPQSYRMTVDSVTEQDKRKTLTIKSVEMPINGFGTLMQNFSSEKYLGKKIRMTAYMKSKDVENWAGFWLRVDGTDRKEGSLSFDNMNNRAIKGTTDWTKYEIVLDVPKEATNIAFGALIHGTGQIWFEKFDFKVVKKSTPVTDIKKKKTQPNLDFNK